MSILERLIENKGTVSSFLGKTLAREALDGDGDVLKEAVELATYRARDAKEKNVRSGAAKIVECVALEKPGMVSPYLEKLVAALEVAEPQTRWMIIRTMGLCAKERPEVARMAIPFAMKFIREKRDGQLCLVSSADIFLGDFGRLSKENAEEALPILMESAKKAILNEHDWIIEAFIKIAKRVGRGDKADMLAFARKFEDHPRKRTRERVAELKELCL